MEFFVKKENKMTDQKLLPCPFCGEKPKMKLSKKMYCQLHGEPYQEDIIYCDNSQCVVRPFLSYGLSSNPNNRNETIERWNTRSTLTPPKTHRRDADGERCLDCGDKDWMNTECCRTTTMPDTQGALEALDNIQEVLFNFKEHTDFELRSWFVSIRATLTRPDPVKAKRDAVTTALLEALKSLVDADPDDETIWMNSVDNAKQAIREAEKEMV